MRLCTELGTFGHPFTVSLPSCFQSLRRSVGVAYRIREGLRRGHAFDLPEYLRYYASRSPNTSCNVIDFDKGMIAVTTFSSKECLA